MSKTRKRLAMFLPSLQGGGVERVMLNLARGFAARGEDILLILGQAEGPYMKDAESLQISDLKTRRTLSCLFPLRRELRAQKPDLLISAHNHANLVSVMSRAISQLKLPLMLTVHSTLSLEIESAPARWRMLPGLIRHFYPRAEKIVAVSNGVADDLAKTAGVPRNRVEVIPNPVVTPDLTAKSMQEVNWPWGKAQDGRPVVIGAGRLDEKKDFATLIRAFAFVRKKARARLIILGEGPERTNLENLAHELGISEDVFLPGFTSNPYPCLANSNLFVLSSVSEGLPTVLIEAMALGVPVVSTNCRSGPDEILDGGRLAPLVPMKNDEELGRAMLEILRSRPDVIPLKKRAEHYALEPVIDRYLGLIHEVLGSK